MLSYTYQTNFLRPITILNCVDFLVAPFDVEIPKIKSLYSNIDKMTNHILRISAIPKKINQAGYNRLAGILNSNYMDCTHPANMSPKIYYIQIQNSQKDSPLTSKLETQKPVVRRRRRYVKNGIHK